MLARVLSRLPLRPTVARRCTAAAQRTSASVATTATTTVAPASPPMRGLVGRSTAWVQRNAVGVAVTAAAPLAMCGVAMALSSSGTASASSSASSAASDDKNSSSSSNASKDPERRTPVAGEGPRVTAERLLAAREPGVSVKIELDTRGLAFLREKAEAGEGAAAGAGAKPKPALTVVALVTEEDAADVFTLYRRLLPETPNPAMLHDFKGKAGQTQVLYTTATDGGASSQPWRLVLVGCGSVDKLGVNDLRKATCTAVNTVRGMGIMWATLVLPLRMDGAKVPLRDALDAVTRTAVQANHTFARHLTLEKNVPKLIQRLHVVCDRASAAAAPGDDEAALQRAVREAHIAAEATLLSRELANTRADDATPQYMAERALDIARAFPESVKVTVLDEVQLRAEGATLITAVGQGSAAHRQPRLVFIEYRGDPEAPPASLPTALVGKGVTYDTGGLNIKPTGSMEDMHLDKSGSTAVLSTMHALARLGAKRNVVGVLALVENAIGSRAYKPHAIIQSAKGSIQISNTDAEGRLALADALTLVQRRYSPSRIIDMATLTGACVVALGEYTAGVFSNNAAMAQALNKNGDRVFERCWPMPILPEHEAELVGTQADYHSCGKGRYGGAITAAAFLKIFVNEGVDWAHVDIAGPSMYSAPRGWMPANGTGFGAQLLLDYVLSTDAAADRAAAEKKAADAAAAAAGSEEKK